MTNKERLNHIVAAFSLSTSAPHFIALVDLSCIQRLPISESANNVDCVQATPVLQSGSHREAGKMCQPFACLVALHAFTYDVDHDGMFPLESDTWLNIRLSGGYDAMPNS